MCHLQGRGYGFIKSLASLEDPPPQCTPIMLNKNNVEQTTIVLIQVIIKGTHVVQSIPINIKI
jgi:hypothetical protein